MDEFNWDDYIDGLEAKQEAWDQYFMSFARLSAANSKCGSRKIGAALVVANRVVATGYNGPAVGMLPCSERYRTTRKPGDGAKVSEYTTVDGTILTSWPESNFCPRRVLGYPSGQGLDICVAAHAERNALLQAAKLGISTDCATLYCYCGQVCKDCAIEIVNAGVVELVFLDGMKDYDALAGEILTAGGIYVRKIVDHTDDVFKVMP